MGKITPKRPSKATLFHKIIGSFFGAGYLPVAPGTWGSAAGIALLIPFFHQNIEWILVGLVVFLTVFAAKIARDLEPEWGEDPKQFVLDEVIGVWAAVAFHQIHWPHLIAAFVLFRIFDILKPFGIRRLEAVPRGWGVQLDDLAAGILANLVIWGMDYFRFLDKF
jgi:phosphatidylglycerophosphatase A